MGRPMVKSLEDILIPLTAHIGVGHAVFSINTRCSMLSGLGRGDLCIGILSMGQIAHFLELLWQ